MGLRNSPPGISCVDVPVGISYISLLFAFVHDNLPAFNNAFGHRGVNNHHVTEHTLAKTFGVSCSHARFSQESDKHIFF